MHTPASIAEADLVAVSGSDGVWHGDELEKKITLTRGPGLLARQAREESVGSCAGLQLG